jgi:hypothetical protein
METNFTNMAMIELINFEQDLQRQLDSKLRNMKYDDELELIYAQLEAILNERRRREEQNNG